MDPDDSSFTQQELRARLPFFAASTKLLGRLDNEAERVHRQPMLDFSILLYQRPTWIITPGCRTWPQSLEPIPIRSPIASPVSRRAAGSKGAGGGDRRGVCAQLATGAEKQMESAMPDRVSAVRDLLRNAFSTEGLFQIANLFAGLAATLGPPPPEGANTSVGSPSFCLICSDCDQSRDGRRVEIAECG